MARLALRALRPRHGLAAVDLDIDAGELLLLSGPSGAGKSVLLRAIADLDPHQGQVWLGERAASAMAPAEWRRRVGLLMAESGWWGATVGDHFPAALHADLHAERLSALGFGLEVLDWSVARLSTGERQRLALARLLARQPEVLLLDEPTANLDSSNRARVEQVILDYRQQHQAAVLWVSHDDAQRQRLVAQHQARALLICERALVAEPCS
ncbi:ABC transporter ATP-binding protein [Rhabdochromatium marinum]|uniref:ABC transporter ATP-binding protein n=1 Tax=Rhabdochromatium marinum TaxID=48729 RepID=UPI001902F1AF|nr:ATP-binding cassette domain-containing protein [Rhabdochromatium marinum]MBK1649158.1 ATP-binding protein [Rhabdochromatium marinum]